jgi:ankyrin repeat protein
MAEKQIGTLIDPKKKAIVLQRIRDGKEPFCATKPEPEKIMREVKTRPKTKKPRAKTRKKPKLQKASVQQLNRMIHHFITAGQLGDVEALLNDGADVNSKNKSGLTALMLAVNRGREDIVELLIKKGAMVDQKDDDGYTALWWAEQHGSAAHKKCAEILKKHGAM